MAFALVNWIHEGKCSITSSKWVLEPQDLTSVSLPVDGVCRWTSQKSR